MPIPVFSGFAEDTEEESIEEEAHISSNTEIVSESEILLEDVTGQSTPQQLSQTELNDLVRDLGLSKKVAEILASRLQEKHLLNNSANVLYFRNRDQSFVTFF